MKIGRTFSRQARPNGRLVYRRVKNVLAPVTINRVTVMLDAPWDGKTIAFSCFLDGKPMIEGEAPGGQAFVLEPNFRIARGETDIRVVAMPFEPNEVVTGRIEIEFSLF